MDSLRYLLLFTLILLICGKMHAFECSSESVERIEAYSSYRVFTEGKTRFTWIEEISKSWWEKHTVTSPKQIESLIKNLCESEKIEDLPYDVYEPAVEIRIISPLGVTFQMPITPWVTGTLFVYFKGHKSPELIWLYTGEFDRGKERYRLSSDFWELLYPNEVIGQLKM